MVYFIGDSIEKNDSLDLLREKLLENSRSLLQLFKERLELGRSVGELKRSRDLNLRDRNQELQVIRKLNVSEPIEERFLNVLFELTIMSEGLDNQVKSEDTILGAGTIQEVLAESICLPGDRISTKACADLPFIQRAISKGAHVVSEDCESFDLRILISRDAENDCIKISNISSPDSARNVKFTDKPRVIKLEVNE
ncbi:MAG: chorismate mutase [Thermoplasmata archaeon]